MSYTGEVIAIVASEFVLRKDSRVAFSTPRKATRSLCPEAKRPAGRS